MHQAFSNGFVLEIQYIPTIFNSPKSPEDPRNDLLLMRRLVFNAGGGGPTIQRLGLGPSRTRTKTHSRRHDITYRTVQQCSGRLLACNIFSCAVRIPPIPQTHLCV